MKIQRPGNTESHLLLNSYLRKNNSPEYSKYDEKLYINWLYTTSGFYDKSIDDPAKNYTTTIKSYNYNKWLDKYIEAINNSLHIGFYLDKGRDLTQTESQTFLKYIDLHFKAGSISVNHTPYYNNTHYHFNSYWCLEDLTKNKGILHDHYDMLEDKIVLVVSAFSELIEYQYNNNINKIFPSFPKFKQLKTYTTPYTFLNNGPDDNFFDTLETLICDISKIKFDIALLSCGTYATFICDHIDAKLNRDSMYMGSGCNSMFGINPHLDKEKYPFWITKIPKHLIYEHSKSIENGVYWHK